MASTLVPCFPREVFANIISNLVPHRPYSISSGEDDIDFAPSDLVSLLHTSTHFQDEVLRQIRAHSLRINLNSGYGCPCQKLESRDLLEAMFKTSFSRLTELPLWAFSEVIVIFSPNLHHFHITACGVRQGDLYARPTRHHTSRPTRPTRPNTNIWPPNRFGLFRPWSHSNQRKSHRLLHSIDCVVRQSIAVGEMLQRRPGPQNLHHKTRFHFKFEECEVMREFDQEFKQVFWDLEVVQKALHPWRWTSPPDRPTPPIDFPQLLCISPNYDTGPIRRTTFGNRFDTDIISEDISGRFVALMVAWWNDQPPPPELRYTFYFDSLHPWNHETKYPETPTYYDGPFRWLHYLRGAKMT